VSCAADRPLTETNTFSYFSYPLASAAEIQAVRDANTLAAPLRDTGSGFMHIPLLAPTPSAMVRSPTDATPLSSIATVPPKPQSPLLPVPVTPLTALLPAADPLLVLVVDDDAVTRVLSSKSVIFSLLILVD
jgi:hypothetical protein